MPEGHKVFRLALDHRALIGKRLKVSSPQGRFTEGAEFLDGRILREVESYGKHLVYRWSGQVHLHIHLGLYGKYRWLADPIEEPVGQVRLRVLAKNTGFDLNGPSRCELLTPGELVALVTRLGPDPLRTDSRPRLFQSAVRKSSKPIGSLLLDQQVIAGLGNIYRSEVLFKLGIHPDRLGHQMTIREIGKIWNLSRRWMKIGVKYNAIITTEPKTIGKPRRMMERDERLLIYKRESCPQCETPIKSYLLGNRTVFVCSHCQT